MARPSGAVLIVNPHAGRGRAMRLSGPLIVRLEAAGVRVRAVVADQARRSLDRARAVIDSDGYDTVLVVGGDGTVNSVLELVAGTDLQLGVMPLGSGNDFAAAVGLPLDVRAAADVLLAGHVRPLDAVRITHDGDAPPRWYAGSMALGFDAAVNARAGRMPDALGSARYPLAALAETRRLTPRRFTLTFDGAPPRPVDALLVAVLNASRYGGGMHVAPEAALDDGEVDVVVVRPVPATTLLRVLPRTYTGGHVGHPAVEIRRARRVGVSVDGDCPAAVDGEGFAGPPLTAEVVPGALRLLAPPP